MGANDFEENSTAQDCLILSSEVADCEYCSTSPQRRDCDGFKAEYIVMIPDQCGNLTMISEFTECVKPEEFILYSNDTIQTCYFLDCVDEDLTFTKPSELTEDATILVIAFGVVIGILSLALLCCIVLCIIDCKKNNF